MIVRVAGTPSNFRRIKTALFVGVTCTVSNILHGWRRGQENEQQNNAPSPKSNTDLGYNLRVQ